MSAYRKALEDMAREWDRQDQRNQPPPKGNGRG